MPPIDCNINISDDLTTNVVKGSISTEDLVNWISNYYSGEITNRILWDFSKADLSGIPTEDFRKIAKESSKKSALRTNGKSALLVCDDLDYGLGRMFQVFSEIANVRFEYKPFKDIKKAMEWLGSENFEDDQKFYDNITEMLNRNKKHKV
ncbi:MAG: hypothetical protein GY760_19020 [Deltaproteobacteria bacterium]|nr:hypothetical protein [Deltaproteobacteria bacterium]